MSARIVQGLRIRPTPLPVTNASDDPGTMARGTRDNVEPPKRIGRIGGRGCPQCGSHHTKQFGKVEQLCVDCNFLWRPCSPHCRGYRFDVHHPTGPCVTGCPDCGVPDRIARHWPESYRALAKELDGKKLEPVGE